MRVDWKTNLEMSEMTLCYLSGPIIHKENRKDNFYQYIVDFLRDEGIDVFAPQFLGPSEPIEIFQRDTQKVRAADFVIAEVSNASHGVGMELMLSIEFGKPLLLFRHAEAQRLSYMVSGASGKALFEYGDLDDITRVLERLNLHNLIIKQCSSCPSDVASTRNNKIHCVQCGADLSE
ncbi:MAG: hypothetical protein GF309_15045 [Candidatus Lokiarchaeota archaeon]|nr:hypothetical protein [Candidatus Lokiarchaeota archaeon]